MLKDGQNSVALSIIGRFTVVRNEKNLFMTCMMDVCRIPALRISLKVILGFDFHGHLYLKWLKASISYTFLYII